MRRQTEYTSAMRHGLTLVELLIVCFILALFVAVAAPLLRPQTEDRKIRETARQVNALFAEAKAYAAQRGRPVGVAFDRRSATGEGARNQNVVTRLYLAESPPLYSGDSDGAPVALWLDPVQVPIPGFTQAPINGNAPRIVSLDFADALGRSAMIDTLVRSYFRDPNAPAPGDIIRFNIRFNDQGTSHAALAYVTGTTGFPPGIAGRDIQYLCVSEYGDSLYNVVLTPRPTPYPTPFPAPTTVRNYTAGLPPVPSSDSPLELPTGTVVDLQYSGYGRGGNQFNIGPTNYPLVVMFGPGGEVQHVINAGSFDVNLSRVHFLVGTAARAIDSTSLDTSNLAEPGAQWVSLQTRTGNVTTADNLPPFDYNNLGAAIIQARGMATGLSTKGGR